MVVNKPLEFVASSDDDITLSFVIDYYETQFNLTLTEIEALELFERIRKWFGYEIK